MSAWERHANTARYAEILRKEGDPAYTFVGIVRALLDPRLDIDWRGPIADLLDAYDEVTR